jgi:hypothetical protein
MAQTKKQIGEREQSKEGKQERRRCRRDEEEQESGEGKNISAKVKSPKKDEILKGEDGGMRENRRQEKIQLIM